MYSGSFRGLGLSGFVSCPLLDSSLYVELLGTTAGKIIGHQYLMVRETLSCLIISYNSGIQFMSIC